MELLRNSSDEPMHWEIATLFAIQHTRILIALCRFACPTHCNLGKFCLPRVFGIRVWPILNQLELISYDAGFLFSYLT